MDDYSLLGIFEGEHNKKKIFVFDADKNSVNTSEEISERDLFQYLINQNSDSFIRAKSKTSRLLQVLGENQNESKIIQVASHRQRPTKQKLLDGLFEIFIVFQTESEKYGDFWWSLDFMVDSKVNSKDNFNYVPHEIILQRSHNENKVRSNFKGKSRETIELIITDTEELKGKGCLEELLTLLWIHKIIDVKYQRYLSRCESIIPLIMIKITKTRYEYHKDFKYSALSAEEKNPDLSDIIDFLSNVPNWHPLIIAIYLGDIELFDKVLQDGKYNINGIYNKFTLLNLAILFSKREMIHHLLEKINVDPFRRDEKGRNALHMTAKFNRETEIIDLLLKKIPIDLCDAGGTTALHHAIMASNTTIVRCLLEKGADPTIFDQNSRSPLHAAAFYARDTKIIDLVLKEKVDINECNKFGATALHNVAMTSNVQIANHLLKRGADIRIRDRKGLTPLHVAAFYANDMEMIQMFLKHEKVTETLRCCDEHGQNVVAYAQKNIYGLGKQIIGRLEEKDGGIMKESNLLKQAKFEIHIPIWKRIVWNLRFYSSITWLKPLASLIDYSSILKEDKLKMFFIPYADLKPGKGCELSEPALIQSIEREDFLRQMTVIESEILDIFNDIDEHSKITQVQIYQSSINAMSDLMGLFQFYIVFKTISDWDGQHWWSLDKNFDDIVLQRSRDEHAVKNKLNGEERRIVTPSNTPSIVGKGSMKNLFSVLLAYRDNQEKYENKNSNSQSFATFISEQITGKENKYEDNSIWPSQTNMLLFVPNAANPEDKHEISETALFRFLLNEDTIQQLKEDQVEIPEMLNTLSVVDKLSKITEVEIHQSSIGPVKGMSKDERFRYSRNKVKYGKLTGETKIPEMLKALRGIDKLSKITEFETHQSSMGILKDFGKAFHVFLVIKTTSETDGDYWWSLKKNLKYIVLQRSRDKNDVKNKFYGNSTFINGFKGKNSIKDLLLTLWVCHMIPEKHNLWKSNCQSFITLVSKQITEIGYEYEGDFTLFSRKKRNTEMLDFIDILKNNDYVGNPLSPLIYNDNTVIFDKVMKNRNYDINTTQQGIKHIMLRIAIVFSKFEMVRHLLNKWKSDPTERDRIGMNALHVAAMFANKNMDIIDLLLAHEKVDIKQRDERNGWTALHWAVCVSNRAAMKHLLDKGADPNSFDKNGRSPLHFAAYFGMGTEIMDLIVKAKNYKGIDDVDDKYGMTALHSAAKASNEIIAEYLIKKGADVNYRDKNGRTPLHLAAQFAENMEIIDSLLLNIKDEDIDQIYRNDGEIFIFAKRNQNGLAGEITDRLRENFLTNVDEIQIETFTISILRKIIRSSDVKKLRDLIKRGLDIGRVTCVYGIDALHFASFYAKKTELIDVILENGQLDINGGDIHGQTPLHYAMKGDNPTENGRYLIEEKGADPNIADEDGVTPLHLAASYRITTDLIDLLLETKKVDINVPDKEGRTALHFAFLANNKNIARHLLEKGADPTKRDKYGFTYLAEAKHIKDTDILNLYQAYEKK